MFTRKFLIIDMTGNVGHSFFSTIKDAEDALLFLKQRFPYSSFKLFTEV